MPLGIEILGRSLISRAKKGLFHSKTVQHGHRITKKGKNKILRMWKPNVHYHSLYSETLDKIIRIQVSTTALRRIDYHGGLDNYLLRTPIPKLNSDIGVKMRELIEKIQKERGMYQERPEGTYPLPPRGKIFYPIHKRR